MVPALHCLHLDDALIAVDKPSGLLSVPGRGPDKADCVAARVQARWPDARVVHRLDMGTSGVMLMARGLAMQQALSPVSGTATSRGSLCKGPLLAAAVKGFLSLAFPRFPAFRGCSRSWGPAWECGARNQGLAADVCRT